MKVQNLVENIKNNNFDLIAELEVKEYLPIELKKTIAQGIIFACTDDSEGVIKVDSVQRYLSYVEHMIKYHTNLEYTEEDYDVLCSTMYGDGNLLNAIMECFGSDAQECSRILDLMMGDYMQENTIEFSVAKFLNGLAGSLDGIADALNDKIDDFDLKSMIPKDVDLKQVMSFLDKYDM